ncbi:MAG: hypothetical protein LBN27_02840 [Prevotellaceae bacterium]|jgi:hypothetical protein|nr:hypothetical protein [Prevotellaceae bacterium]
MINLQGNAVEWDMAKRYDNDFDKAYATAISGEELRQRLYRRMKQWKMGR